MGFEVDCEVGKGFVAFAALAEAILEGACLGSFLLRLNKVKKFRFLPTHELVQIPSSPGFNYSQSLQSYQNTLYNGCAR
jgi:hypothetical protein